MIKGKMEEDFVEDCNYVETDEEYEFDASQFYDFARPEFDSEIEEAERWFEVSGDYPHSPFFVKLNLEKILSVEVAPNSSSAKDSKNTTLISSCSYTDSRHGVFPSKKNAKEKGYPTLQNTAKARTKPADKFSRPRSATFMEPTASHLAKQHKVHSGHLCTRFQRTTAKLDQKSNVVGSDNFAVKRQKLEIGYLTKASHLKHQFSLLHKSSKKVTVPREPELETQLRAQKRRSKNSCASSETEKQKQKGCNLKAHPLNRKILQARSLPQPKKSKPHSPEFQEKRLSAGYNLPESPLTEQFNELSLGANVEANSASQLERHSSAKASGKAMRCNPKPNQCGGHMRVHEANMTRSLDIH